MKKVKYFTPSKDIKLKSSYGARMSYDKGALNFEDFATTNEVQIGQAGISLELPKDQKQLKEYKSHIQAALIEVFSQSNAIYTDVSMEDIIPKPEDFVYKPFRLLSATIVAGHSYRATNFGHKPEVLKRALKKLIGKPVYPEHNMDVRSWVGMVLDPTWEEAKKSLGYKPKKAKQGQKIWDGMIPAGINGTIAIDSKSDPKLARGIMMGTVFSNSVTVSFEWQPSHDDFENEWEFFDSIGRIHSDGRMVTRDVTNIVEFYESSMVALGADPFAKAISENSTLVNIDESAIVPLSKESDEIKKNITKFGKYSIDSCLDDNFSLSLRRSENFIFNIEAKKETIGMENDKSQEELLNTELETLKAQLAKDVEAKDIAEATVITLTAENAQLKAQKEAIEAEKASWTKEKESLQAAKVFFDTQVTELKAEIKKAYALKTETPNEQYLKLVDKTEEIESLQAMLETLQSDNIKKFGGVCKKCNSTNITFRKSLPTPDGTQNTQALQDEPIFDPDEIRENYNRY